MLVTNLQLPILLPLLHCLCWQVHQICVAQGFPNFLALEERPWRSVCSKEPLILCLSDTCEEERRQRAPHLTIALTLVNGYTRLIFAHCWKGWIGRIISSLAIVKKKPHRWSVMHVNQGAHRAPESCVDLMRFLPQVPHSMNEFINQAVTQSWVVVTIWVSLRNVFHTGFSFVPLQKSSVLVLLQNEKKNKNKTKLSVTVHNGFCLHAKIFEAD